MITADDWAAFEADVAKVDNRSPVVEDNNYADWAKYSHIERETHIRAAITILGRIGQ